MAQSTVAIKGTTFTVYGSQDGIDDYMNGHSDSSLWTAATTETKNRARVTAARSFDRQNWVGVPTDPTTPQALQWPRDGVVDAFGQPSNGVTPDAIEEGNWEWALLIVKNGGVAGATPGTNTKRTRSVKTVDVITVEAELELFKSTIGKVTRFPTAVHELVGIYLSGGNVPLSFGSGLTEVSVFTDADFDFSGIGIDGGANA